jgi:nucleotide-binding universal stress UspA family protein
MVGMKTILIPMVNHGAMRSALETALLLARRYDSYMEGVALRSSIDAIAIAAGAIPPSTNANDSFEDVIQARAIFDSFMLENGVPRSTKSMRSLSFGWLDEAPEGEGLMDGYGRVFDVIVMNRLDSDLTGLYTRAIDAALVESGRPVILSTASPPRQIGNNVLIVWSGAMEQARATALAMPLLNQADQVTVLSIHNGNVRTGPCAEKLIHYLQRNEVDADLLNISFDGKNIGKTILTVANSLGCDLLINGVNMQSRLQRLLLGNTTKYVLENATTPILLAN